MQDVGLKDLEAVVAIARRGSFRAAAVDLGLSTTTLSHMIAKLEAGLGVRLFNRTTRSVALTEAGRIFMDSVTPSLLDLRGALETVRSKRETPSGTIRINAAPFAGRAVMDRLIPEFLQLYPDMTVDLVTEGRLVDIVRDGFDLGLRVAALVPSDMIAVSLGRPHRHAVVGSPDYFRQRPQPKVPADLLQHACIRARLPDGSMLRWRFEKEGETLQIDVPGRIVLDEVSLVRRAVTHGLGLGYVIDQDLDEEIAAGRLVRVLEDWTPALPGLCLYYPSRRNLSAGLRAFLDLARHMAREAQSSA